MANTFTRAVIAAAQVHLCHVDVLLQSLGLTPNDLAEVVFEALLVLLQGEFYRGHVREARKDLQVRLLFDEIYRCEIVGIEHRDFELVALVGIHDDVVPASYRLRNERERIV